MIVGFTGTQRGMTAAQRETVDLMLRALPVSEGHHGDCIGADADFDALLATRGIRRVAHPGCDGRGLSPKRAFCTVDETRITLRYMERNRAIIGSIDLLIATPAEDHEVLRSGTWATIRMANKTGRPVQIVYPDGTTR